MKPDSDLVARFAYRFVPISIACKASGNLEEFKRLVRPLVKKFIEERKMTVLKRN